MVPEQFIKRYRKFSFTSDDLEIRTTVGAFSNKWVIFLVMGDERIPLTQSADVTKCLRWMQVLRMHEDLIDSLVEVE